MATRFECLGAGMSEADSGGLPSNRSVEAVRLEGLLRDSGLRPLDPEAICRFDAYLKLILKWNARMNLTAVRDAEGHPSPGTLLSRSLVRRLCRPGSRRYSTLGAERISRDSHRDMPT